MHRFTLLLILATFLSFNTLSAKKSIEPTRVSSAPNIDGELDDAQWSLAQSYTGFSTFEPDPGKEPAYQTEIKIIYDDEAIYIGYMAYDDEPDKILKEYGYRDQLGANADHGCIFLDTYNDGQNGYAFCFSVSDMRADARYSPSEGENWNWNGIWNVKSKIQDNGWTAEIIIPYSTLRFSELSVQEWGFDAWRVIRRIRERSSWNGVDPNNWDAFVSQWGKATNLKDIEPPVRLAFIPYVTATVDSYLDRESGDFSSANSYKGGLDLKYGINESFTLDMTLIPDFGQVRTDDVVLNLTPFEIQFDEARPFFLEGTELFSKGSIFYSRRIGARPIDYGGVYDLVDDSDQVTYNPSTSQLLNATKLSGRTNTGLGLGFFNATSGEIYATYRDSEGEEKRYLTSPLTNYNILVIDRPLNDNSYVSLTNTNVMREGIYRDANVTAMKGIFVDDGNNYRLNVGLKVSQIFNPDSDEDISLKNGHAYNFHLSKISGPFNWQFGHYVESDKYDPNDLGFLFNNNENAWFANMSYDFNRPIGIFNSIYNRVGLFNTSLYNPNYFSALMLDFSHRFTTREFFTFGISYGSNLKDSYDYFKPRTDGRFVVIPKEAFISGFISSDYRKKLALDFNADLGRRMGTEEYTYQYGPRLLYRVNDRLKLIYQISYEFEHISDYVTHSNDQPIFGLRDIRTVENTLNLAYKFSSRAVLNLRPRHFWSNVEPLEYYDLRTNGTYGDTDYNESNIVDFNRFNIDLIYQWEFAPGSELSLVWKNLIFDQEELLSTYSESISRLGDLDQNNSLSLKAVYYLDYNRLNNALPQRLRTN